MGRKPSSSNEDAASQNLPVQLALLINELLVLISWESSSSPCGLFIDPAWSLRCGISSISRKTAEVSGRGTVSGLLSRSCFLKMFFVPPS